MNFDNDLSFDPSFGNDSDINDVSSMLSSQVSGFDTDGDGMMDLIDVNGDGLADLVDTNNDGVIDAQDTNMDGIADVFDTNGDSIVDAADTDGDQMPDLFNTDNNWLIDADTEIDFIDTTEIDCDETPIEHFTINPIDDDNVCK